MLLAVEDLVARGLLAREDDLGIAAIRIGGRGYRYRSLFWTLTGVLEADGPRWRVRLQGRDAEAARRRVAEAWVLAGAPDTWARTEAEASVMRLTVRPEMAARA